MFEKNIYKNVKFYKLIEKSYVIGCFRQWLQYSTSDIEFGIDIQTSQLAVKNHVNLVINHDVLMFTSENHVNTMTSEICTNCTSSMRIGVSACWASFRKFDWIII